MLITWQRSSLPLTYLIRMAIFLGIDPGLATVGFGVIESQNGTLRFLDCGIIKTLPTTPFSERLGMIRSDLLELLMTYKPDCVGIEELFFAKNVKTALSVAHARGVIVEAVQSRGIDMCTFTPLQVKNNIAGDGAAEKWQIQQMVKQMLNLSAFPKPDDAADALAIAICAERVKPYHKAAL